MSGRKCLCTTPTLPVSHSSNFSEAGVLRSLSSPSLPALQRPWHGSPAESPPHCQQTGCYLGQIWPFPEYTTSTQKLPSLPTKAGHSVVEPKVASIFREKVPSWDLGHYAE